MVHLGRDLSNTVVEWREHNTVITKGEEMCQEILLLIDVGACSEFEEPIPIPSQAQP